MSAYDRMKKLAKNPGKPSKGLVGAAKEHARRSAMKQQTAEPVYIKTDITKLLLPNAPTSFDDVRYHDVGLLLDALKPGRLWRHVKSKADYIIESVSRAEATQELTVVYRSRGSGTVWTRPLSNFLMLGESVIGMGIHPLPRFIPVF